MVRFIKYYRTLITGTEEESVSGDHQDELPKKVRKSKVNTSRKVETESLVVTKSKANDKLEGGQKL